MLEAVTSIVVGTPSLLVASSIVVSLGWSSLMLVLLQNTVPAGSGRAPVSVALNLMSSAG
jgi:hypothetical protein